MNKRQELFVIFLLLCCTGLLVYLSLAGNHAKQASLQPVKQQPKAGSNVLPTLTTYSQGKEEYVTRSINLSLSSDQSKEVYKKITEITAQNDGIITRSNITGIKDKNYSGSMVLVIPADKIKDVLGQFNRLNAVVNSEKTNTNNVETQRKGLQGQLDLGQDLQSKYLAVMKTTKSIGDITVVTNRLTDEMQQIQSTKQLMNKLNRDISSISINIDLNPTPEVVVVDQSWKPFETAVNAAKSLKATMQALVAIGIWLAVYMIPLLLLCFIVHFIYRMLGYRRLKG